MPCVPPSPADLQRLADTALGHVEGEGQATVLWERQTGREDRLVVTFTAVEESRAWSLDAGAHDDTGLARAAKAARLKARSQRAWPSAGLPDPAATSAHGGFDPAVLDPPAGLTTGAARIAIASTRGVRVTEQRSFAEYRAVVHGDRRTGVDSAVAVGPDGIEKATVEATAAARAAGEPAGPAPAEDLPVVLGPGAVAWILDRLRPAFGVDLALGHGPLANRRGTRVASSAVGLSDVALHPGTLPRSLDAEGVARQPVVLIEDGVAGGQVHDTASAARTPGSTTTGHATQAAALAPLAEHLVLNAGDAQDVDALCASVKRGIHIPVIEAGRALAPDLILEGERRPLADVGVVADPLALLASVEALTATQQLVRLPGHCPGGPGAALVPALRAARGLRLTA